MSDCDLANFIFRGNKGYSILGRRTATRGLQRDASGAGGIAGWGSGKRRLPASEEIVAGRRAAIGEAAFAEMLDQSVFAMLLELFFGAFLQGR
jgi:hypothetical protein